MTAKVSITKVEPNTSDFGISQSQVIVNEVTGELYTRTLNNQVKRVGADTAFTPSGTGAASGLTVQDELRRVYYPEQFVQAGDANDYASINRALTLAKSGGAGIAVHLTRRAYEIGTNKLSMADGVSLIGKARGGTIINASGGTGAIVEVDSATHVTVGGIRWGFGTSATQIGLNILTTTGDVRWCKFFDMEMAPSSIVAGQKGIQAVVSGGHIITDNTFEDINFYGIDQPIIRTGIEGNFWRGIDIDTWGATAGVAAIASSSHADQMQARIASVPSGGATCVGYQQSQPSNIDNLVIDIGASNNALNVSIAGNIIELSRTNGNTPLGTCVTGNMLIDANTGIDGTPIGANTATTGKFTSIGATSPVTVGNGLVGTPSYAFTNETNTGFWRSATGELNLAIQGSNQYIFTNGAAKGLQINSGLPLNFAGDTFLFRDSASNILAQRNANAAQEFRVYAGNGGFIANVKTVTESLTIAAAATTVGATTIPAGAILLGVSVRVTTVIPTAATFTYATTTGGTTLNTAAVSVAANSTDPGTAAGASYRAAATTVTITPNLTPGAATGVVRLQYYYLQITPPTS